MRDDPELRSGLAAQTALGRVGRPEEIADAIAALVSDELRWVTAERLEVSGGALL
jgi:NAD(P)-dependent dehydrogenase (short-subunit alcohol dehydrogenase family)